MSKINVKLLWIAAIIAIICTGLFYKYLSSLEKREEVISYKEVIVAKQNILPNTKITSGLIEKQKIRADSISYSVSEEDILNKYVKDTILKGEQIRTERLVKDDEKQLYMKIPEGKRAVSVQVNEFIAVGDMIEPGNFVDVYINQDEKTVETSQGKLFYINQTKLLLQNIQVLAISKEQKGNASERDKVPTSYSITLALTSQEAERLIYAESFATIKIALRPVNDTNIDITYGVNEVTMRAQ